MTAPDQALKAAVEFMEKAATMLDRGEMPVPGCQYSQNWSAAHRTLLAALSSQASVMEEMAKGLEQAESAIGDVIGWDTARGFPIPYRVRDPLHGFLVKEQYRTARQLLQRDEARTLDGLIEALTEVQKHFDGENRDKDWAQTERFVRQAIQAGEKG